MAAASCLLAAVMLGVIQIRRRYMVVTVVGISMTPSFHDGDRLLVRRCGTDHVSVGTAVVLRAPTLVLMDAPPARKPSPSELIMVKRVAAVHGEAVPESVRAAVGGVRTVPAGMFVVLGDNPGAMDSRRLGFVAAGEILGPIVLRLSQRHGSSAGAGGRRFL